MPDFYMLVGVPLSGKSTWLNNNRGMGVVLSTDNIIDSIARSAGMGYNDLWKGQIKRATDIMNDILKIAIDRQEEIYWDQTNLTLSSRRAKLARIPRFYTRIAVVLETPDMQLLIDRNEERSAREGKFIPYDVIERMISQFEYPSKDEGFDEIKIIRNFG